MAFKFFYFAGMYVDDADVNVLPASRLVAVNGEDVIRRLKRGAGFWAHRHLFVFRAVTAYLSGERTVHVDFRVFVMVQTQLELSIGGPCGVADAAQPNVGRVPDRPDMRAGRAAAAEASRTIVPAAVIEAGLEPVVTWFDRCVAPDEGFVLGGGHDGSNHGCRRWRGVETLCRRDGERVHFHKRAVVSHEAIDLDFDVRGWV